MHTVSLSDIQEARSRLEGIITRTRLIEFNHDAWMPHVSRPSRDVGTSATAETRRLFLKPENQQPIGAFKLRGAYNKIASLSEQDRNRGVISYSSGNHAQGVAYAARALGVKAIIVMPNNAPAIKREATAALDAADPQLFIHDGQPGEARPAADRGLAEETRPQAESTNISGDSARYAGNRQARRHPNP